MNNNNFFLSLCLLGLPCLASPLIDTPAGLLRSGSQDAIFHDDDPFSGLSNPSWNARFSHGESNSFVYGFLKSKRLYVTSGEKSSHQYFAYAKQGQFLNTLPYSWAVSLPYDRGFPLLKTADASRLTSPWFHRMNTLLLAPSFAYRLSGWDLGLGLPIFFSNDSYVNYDFGGSTPKAVMESKLKPVLRFSLGVSKVLENKSRISAAYFEMMAATSTVRVDTRIPVGPLLEANLLALTQAYYDSSPRKVVLQYEQTVSDRWLWAALLRWSQWSLVAEPNIQILEINPQLSLANPRFKAQDSWDFVLAAESAFEGFSTERLSKLSYSYKFQQSPFSKLSTVFYDKDQHKLALGWLEPLTKAWAVGASAQGHVLRGSAAYYWFAGLGLVYKEHD